MAMMGRRREDRRSGTSIAHAFNYAIAGIVHAVRTERNMRLHLGATLAILGVARILGAPRTDVAVIVAAATLVLVAELINTAIEQAIDIATSSYDPRARIAKDVAAGAVLISAVAAVALAYLVLADELSRPSTWFAHNAEALPIEVTGIALAATVCLAVALKALTGRGTPARGGFPSGHAAVAASAATAIVLLTAETRHQMVVASLSALVVVLVAQSRVEAGIHSFYEVAVGAALGLFTTLLVFQIG